MPNIDLQPIGVPVDYVTITRYPTPSHPAYDFGVPSGTPVISTMNGRVEFSGWNNDGCGNSIRISNNRYRTHYCHLSKILVNVGDVVGRGNLIGLSGNTGNSTGDHLHYQIDYMGKPYYDITVKVSHYEPALGGVNCGNFVNGKCVSRMANGEKWESWIDKAAACPFELPFETKIIIGDSEWICKDRGGMIVREGNYLWIDLLTENPEYNYGEMVNAVIILP